MQQLPSKQVLSRYFSYNPLSGSLKWKRRDVNEFRSESAHRAWNKRWSGSEAGSTYSDGKRRHVRLNGRYFDCDKVCAVLSGMPESEVSSGFVRHANGDPLDNRKENLYLSFDRAKRDSRPKPEAEFLFHEFLDYYPDNGEFGISKYAPNEVKDSINLNVIVTKRGTSYRYVSICYGKLDFIVTNREVAAHRLAWRAYYGEWPKGIIDHIDGDGLNNRISNLRDVTCGLNMKNKRRYRKNTSGLSGVRWESTRQKWVVSCGPKKIGRFSDKFEAFCARMSALAKDEDYTLRHGR